MWINVNDKLPEQHQDVIAYHWCGNEYFHCTYIANLFELCYYGQDVTKIFKPTHWMPLPDPPKND